VWQQKVYYSWVVLYLKCARGAFKAERILGEDAGEAGTGCCSEKAIGQPPK